MEQKSTVRKVSIITDDSVQKKNVIKKWKESQKSETENSKESLY